MITLKTTAEEYQIDRLNQDNLETFYTHYFPKIYNYIRFRINDPHDTDDLTSKVFEKVIVHAERFNSEKGTFSAWIFAIANNLVIDYFKSKSGRTKKVSLDLVANTISGQKGPEHKIIDRELKNNLLAALQDIDEKKRALIALKFWSGLNNRQIAEMVGLTESNVGVTLYRTLKQLKEILVKRGVDFNG